MDIVIYIVTFAMFVAGLAGCFIPVIPGPPLAFVGYLLLLFTPVAESMPVATVVALGAVTLLSVVLDFVIPSIGVRLFGGTSYGKWGCLVGTFLGLAFMPWGLVAGPFLGAFIAEMIGNRAVDEAFKSGLGSLVGFLCGTFFKVVVVIAIIATAIVEGF